jgi:uncharacterized protein
MKLSFYLLGILLVVLTGWFLLKSNSISSIMHSEIVKTSLTASPSPSPSPLLFEELTIPYLRSRKHESKIGELEKYQDNGNYISYLTSYTSDGLKVNGLLTEPAGERPASGWPAIVFIHGYIPPSTYKTTEKYVDYVDYLARNGYVVFKIDLRGHGDSEGEPGGAYYSSDYIVDALNAYSALQNSGFVNPQKIGLWGHSMAGNIVLRSLAAKPEIPVAVIWAGAGYTYLDLSEFGLNDNSYRPSEDQARRNNRRQLLRNTYGDPKDGNPFWNLVAPTNYLNDFKGAIQLDHAVVDDVVNIGYSRNLNEILNRTTIPHELNEYPSGGHNITNPSFTPAMQKTVDFFDKYLKN